ncbi:MAG: cytochrome c oxidase subunit 3 [Alphaproteobacteria bacterium]|nr:cytochrome c oxidase subunit 3 [Alphaproteobacteria bacterium]
MAFFIVAEAMLFFGFVSGHVIVEANAMGGWPPPGQPRLPVASTAVNTLFLLASGAILFYAGRRFRESADAARRPFVLSVALGALFVLLQGYEWQGLIREGLTLSSSSYGSFFYMIVGTHALHAVGAIGWLFVLLFRLQKGWLTEESFQAGRMLWYFVVLIWPMLYWQVYL